MNIFITLIIVGIIAAGAWNLRDGSLDLPSKLLTNKSSLTKVSTSANIPPEPKSLKEKAAGLIGNFSTNQYGSFLTQIKAKSLPFKVLLPSYIPSGFKFLKEDSAKIVQGNRGIPQINYLFESAGGENGMALRQFDKIIYRKTMEKALGQSGFKDWPTFFAAQHKAKPIERGGQTIYVRIPAEKVRSIVGDLQYIASAHLVNDDSVIELNYMGETAFSEAELIKIVLALKPAR